MTNNNPKIIVISGPSGVGKDAVISQMSHQFKNFHFTVTATTRQKREMEKRRFEDEQIKKSHFSQKHKNTLKF